MITTEACAQANSRVFGVPEITTLVNIATTVEAINTACQALTDEVRPQLPCVPFLQTCIYGALSQAASRFSDTSSLPSCKCGKRF